MYQFLFGNSFLEGYLVSSILLLTAYLFFKAFRDGIKKVQQLSNIIILITATIGLIIVLTEILSLTVSGSGFDKFAFVNSAFGPYWFTYWFMIVSRYLLPQLFWFKKLRNQFWPVILMIVFYLVYYVLLPYILLLIPSTWKAKIPWYYSFGGLYLSVPVYLLLLTIAYVFRRKHQQKTS